jgi:hypothetical protein
MEVLGRDSAREAYRVATDGPDGRIVGLLPEALIGRGPLTGGLGHQTAYHWLARHADAIEAALRNLQGGRRARAPFDALELEEPR